MPSRGVRKVVAFLVSLVGLFSGVGCERKLDPPRADTVTLTLAPDDLSSDDGVTVASALVTERRVPLRNWPVEFAVALTADSGANPTYAPLLAVTDVNGIARVTLSGLSVAGAGTVTATVLDDDGAPYLRHDVAVASVAPLRVRTGVPTSLDATLSSASLDLANGSSIDVSWIVRDAQANRTSDPVEIVTDQPGATVLGVTVADISVAGGWSVTVSVVGHPDISDTESFQVLPGGVAVIDAFLSNATTDAYLDPVAHPPVVVDYRVLDATGNDVTAGANVSCAIDALSGGAVTAVTGVVSPLVVKGTFPVTCTLMDAGSNVLDTDTETLTVVDLTPPALAILSPAAGTHFPSRSTMNVTVRATDVVGVVSMTSQVAGLGGSSAGSELVTGDAVLARDVTTTFALQTTVADFFEGTQTVYASALDGSGNAANAASVSVVIDPFVVMPSGITISLVREDVNFNSAVAIAWDPTSAADMPVFFLADPGAAPNGVIWKLTYDRLAGTSTMIAAVTGYRAGGLEFNAAGTLLFAPDQTNNQVRVFDYAGGILAVNRTVNIPGGANFQHAVFGPTSPTSCPTGPCLYVADVGSDTIWLLDTSNDSSTLFADNGTTRNGGGPALQTPYGIAYDPATSALFVSDFGSNDRVYELTPDGGDGNGTTDSLSVFMQRGTALGPDPDVQTGLEYRGMGGTGLYANQLFSANTGDDRMLGAIRDGGDGNLLSDQWTTFLEGVGRPPLDMTFQAGTGRMYVLFDTGNGMSQHVVELSGF